MKKSVLYRYVPNVLFSVLMALFAVIMILILLISHLAFKSDLYTQIMDKNNVSDLAYEEITTYFDRQSAYTGIEAEVFAKGVTKESVHEAIYAYVDNSFSYMTGDSDTMPQINYDFAPLEKSIDDNFHQWATDNDIEFDDNLQKSEDTTISETEKVVTTKIDVLMLSYINKQGGISTKIHNNYGLLSVMKIAVMLIMIILLLVCIAINKRNKKNSLYWISSSVFTASAIILIPSIALKATHYFDGLVLKNDAIYKTATQILDHILTSTIVAGAVSFFVAIILMLVYALFAKKQKAVSPKT